MTTLLSARAIGAVVIGPLLAMALLTAVPVRFGARGPVGPILRSEAA
jgi:hypothetical protein